MSWDARSQVKTLANLPIVCMMAVRFRIGVKIFALALCLLSITVALSIFGTLQSRSLRRELVQESSRDLPLEDVVMGLDQQALRRRLEFERWTALLDQANPDPDAVNKVAASYKSYDNALRKDIDQARSLLNDIKDTDPGLPALTRVKVLLDTIQRDQALAGSIQQSILRNQATHTRAGLNELYEIHEKAQGDLEADRLEVVKQVQGLAERAAQRSEAREVQLATVTASVTGFAILFGLAFAWLMTRRMVQPVQVLMSGVKSVEQGDFSVKVPVASSDEIGVLTTSFNTLVDQLRSKEHLKEIFGKYVDPRIVESVILNPGSAETEGGKRVMTVSFCDLVGFTGISESLAPSGLVRLLNRHFALMASALHEHHGVLDKFIGDAVMAFWGPPFCGSAEHATLACRTALAQLKLMETFRAELPELTGLRKNLPNVDLRVGLASGDVIVGNIGAENSRSYTVIGDTVNLASRLEGVNRIYGTQILMNQETRNLAGSAIETREIDWIAVKGKAEPVIAYELLGFSGAVSEDRLSLRDRYEEAVAAYRMFDWPSAAKSLREALEISPADGPSNILLSRVERFQSEPPKRDWDGVWHLAEK